MDKVECFFKYRNLDMILVVSDYTVDENGDVYIVEYKLELDYFFGGAIQNPADPIMHMITGMLQDGSHLKEKIMYAMSDDDIERIQKTLREASNEYWQDYYEEEGDHLLQHKNDRRLDYDA